MWVRPIWAKNRIFPIVVRAEFGAARIQPWVMRPPPDQIEALLLPFDLYYVALSVPSYGRTTGALKWRVLEHPVTAKNSVLWASHGPPPMRGASNTPSVKPVLSRSFVVCRTCWVVIWVREVTKCNRFMRWRFDIWHFFQVAWLRILGRHFDMSCS